MTPKRLLLADNGSPARTVVCRYQTSVCSAISNASSTSILRYLTALSSFECPEAVASLQISCVFLVQQSFGATIVCRRLGNTHYAIQLLLSRVIQCPASSPPSLPAHAAASSASRSSTSLPSSLQPSSQQAHQLANGRQDKRGSCLLTALAISPVSEGKPSALALAVRG